MGNPEYSTACLRAEMSEILAVGVREFQKRVGFFCQMKFANGC